MIETIRNDILDKIDNIFDKLKKDKVPLQTSIIDEIRQNVKRYTPDNYYKANHNVNIHIENAYLKPDITYNKVNSLIKEACTYNFACICIPPSYVKYAKSHNQQVKVSTVIGFPLGYTFYETKLEETKEALDSGADELDMVINISFLKGGRYFYVFNEIYDIKNLAKDKIVKVIIENCYLTFDEKIIASILSYIANADFIKTSTGFGASGAKLEDIILMKMIYGNKEVSASGDVRTEEFALELLNHGITRLCTSSSLNLI